MSRPVTRPTPETPTVPGANMIRAATAELVGTFLLVLVGTAVATAATLGRTTAGPA